MIRWDEPIEALAMDGRSARATMVDLMDRGWALVFIDEMEAATRVAPNGHAPGTGWVIRNVAQPAGELPGNPGQLPSPEIVGRMVALVREVAEVGTMLIYNPTQADVGKVKRRVDEARAILAELEPVDGDKFEIAHVLFECGVDPADPNTYDIEAVVAAALKRGRELERGA